jgi:hypothetical protein
MPDALDPNALTSAAFNRKTFVGLGAGAAAVISAPAGAYGEESALATIRCSNLVQRVESGICLALLGSHGTNHREISSGRCSGVTHILPVSRNRARTTGRHTTSYAASSIFCGDVRPGPLRDAPASADTFAYAAKRAAAVRVNYGARDTSIDPGDVRALFASLAPAHELSSIYDDAGHAFFDDTRPRLSPPPPTPEPKRWRGSDGA